MEQHVGESRSWCQQTGQNPAPAAQLSVREWDGAPDEAAAGCVTQ